MKRRILATCLAVLAAFGGVAVTASSASAGGATGCCRATH